MPLSSRGPSRAATLRLRRLTARHAPALVALRARVLATLAHPDLYVAEPDEAGFIARHHGARGAILGLFDGATLVAYGMLRLPDAAPLGSGPAIPVEAAVGATVGAAVNASAGAAVEAAIDAVGAPAIPVTADAARWDAATRERLPELSSCMVDPAWRGRGLQRRLIAARLRYGHRHGATRFWAVVSPRNAASQHNLRMAGFRAVGTADIDGHHRLVMGWEKAGVASASTPASLPASTPV